MSRLLLLAHVATFGAIPSRAPAHPRTRTHARSEYVAIAFFILALIGGVAYLFIVNSLATTGFSVKARSVQLERLERERAALVAEHELRKSWDSIVPRLPELQLVESKKIDYIQALDPVALASYATPSP
ncbi:hypothetical protein HY624_03315 [Candidatus Uhrbacteria bacterium]|nr:hypothetical protein [Candidatus Uhrbacteria bacterium]